MVRSIVTAIYLSQQMGCVGFGVVFAVAHVTFTLNPMLLIRCNKKLQSLAYHVNSPYGLFIWCDCDFNLFITTNGPHGIYSHYKGTGTGTEPVWKTGLTQ